MRKPTIKINLLEGDEWGLRIYNEICDYAANYISEKTGCCDFGYKIGINIVATNIEYDIDEPFYPNMTVETELLEQDYNPKKKPDFTNHTGGDYPN